MHALEHYGIKGMKWGVRRTPEQLGHRQSKNRPYRSVPKELVSKGVKTKQELSKNVLSRDLSKSQLTPRNLDSGAVRLKKGEKVQHITGVDFGKIRPGQLYVTADARDNDMYVSFLGARLKSKGFNPAKVVFDLKTDLTAPSSKQQYKMFKDFLKDNQKQVEKDVSQWLSEKGKDPKIKENTKDLYDQFINSVEKPSKSQKEFYSMLKKNGYNAVLDEHDITGSWMQAQKPLIIMDTLSTIGNMRVEKLDVSDMQKALDRLMNSK